MENKPLKINNKVSSELLNLLAKMIIAFRDNELTEAFNRVEIQVKEYEETGQPCDLTYLRDLCNQFDDKLIASCKAKTEMAKMMMNPDMLNKLGLSTGGMDTPDAPPDVKAKIGFKS